jgi:hypothetical protein
MVDLGFIQRGSEAEHDLAVNVIAQHTEKSLGRPPNATLPPSRRKSVWPSPNFSHEFRCQWIDARSRAYPVCAP